MKKIYIMNSSIDTNRGGLTRVMFERASGLSAKGYDVSLLTIDYSERYEEIEQELHETNRLSKSVHILNVYDYYKKKNTRIDITDEQVASYQVENGLDEEGFIVQKNSYENRKEARYFNNEGIYVKYKKWNNEGEVLFIDYFNENRTRLKRVEYGKDKTIKKVTYFTYENKAKQEIYYTTDGFPYLNVSLHEETGKPHLIFVFDRENAESLCFGGSNPNLLFHAHWIQSLCESHTEKPIIINDGIFLTHTLLKVDPKVATRISTIHLNHFDSPFIEGSPIRPSHKHLLDNFGKLDALVLLTENQSELIKKQFGDFKNSYVIPNSTAFTDVYKGDKDSKLISMVGRYHSQKAIDDAIKAFKIVVKNHPDAKFEIYGNGPLENELKKLIHDFGLEEQVKLNKYTTDLVQVYGKSLFTILSSRYEGFGLVILESMYQSTPVISYDVPFGPKDIIDNGENGILVENKNIGELANKMTYLLDNPEIAIEMGQKAHEKVLNNYSSEDYIEKWISLFNKLENNK
ncbi:glycosyltransferase [Bacillus rhizoplanae]|uniref:glycosyltransferase n=1 Tax=Bacillus rhizoplanae TaxID=2880966 RepID=UPI003D1B8BB6